MSGPPAPGEPRVAHYLYAHRAVPRAFLRNPPAILGILSSDDGMEFLTGMWGVLHGELEPAQRLTNTSITLEHYPCANGVFISLVTMPPPLRVFEAFYVGLAARLEGNQFARAFTLDRATPAGLPLETGILEWDTEGKHTICEASAAAEPSSFVDALESLVTTSDSA